MKMVLLEERLKTVETAEQSARRHSNRIVFYRFAAFCLVIVFFGVGYDSNPLFYIASAAMVLLFARLLQIHKKIRQQLILLASRKEVFLQYQARLDGSWSQFPEDGLQFLQEDHPQGNDLDLFGPSSLYQYTCVAQTAWGRKKLAQALSPKPPVLPEDIGLRQKAIAELLQSEDLCLEIQTLNRLLPDNHDVKKILLDLVEKISLPFSFLRVSAIALPLLTFAMLILAALGWISWEITTIPMLVQFALSGVFFTRTETFLLPLFEFYRGLKPYEQLFLLLEKQEFHSPELHELQQKLRIDHGAAHAILNLRRIGECTNVRRNIFFYFIANTLLLWDFHCILLFDRWKNSVGKNAATWLEAFAKLEMLLSLAVVGQVKEQYCFPQILPTNEPELHATDVKHVLIDEKIAVANSITALAGTCILTGSNMSGKTTFMRTLGTTAVLAYAGAPVCAESFTLSRMHIFTSMRVHDDISRGLSTFYAELLRIKAMVEYNKKELPMLILIDEIFKGTNSADRIIGAQEAIRKLTRKWNLTFVSTHDFELCDLINEQALPITNYHFAEYYTDDEIHFDYKLKDGRCQSTNAKYLLKLAGIL
jgi:hypothetical protein